MYFSSINSNKLKGRIVEFGYTQSELAEKLGLSATGFNNKLNGRTEFTASEISELSSILEIGNKDEYFFV